MTDTGEVIVFAEPISIYDWTKSSDTLGTHVGEGWAPRSGVGRLEDGRRYVIEYGSEFNRLDVRSVGTTDENGNRSDERSGATQKVALRIVDSRDWANDLIDKMATLQNEDGSFKSVDSRWMEDNPVLITAYALLALQHAVD